MEQLKRKFNLDPLNHFIVRIGDLVNFEGPMITLFQDVRDGRLYIFDWVDRNKEVNRWIVYQTTPELLINFLNGNLTYNTLFTSPANHNYYYTDIGLNSFFPNNDIFELEKVPNKYYPNTSDYFDIDDCPQYDKILSLAKRSLEDKKEEINYSSFLIKSNSYKNLKDNNFKSHLFQVNSIVVNYSNEGSHELKTKKYQTCNLGTFKISKQINRSSNFFKHKSKC